MTTGIIGTTVQIFATRNTINKDSQLKLKEEKHGCWANPDDWGNVDDFLEKKLKIGRLNQVEMYRISIREDAEAVLGLLQKNGLDFRIKIRF